MIREYYEQICAGDEVRQNLIALRNELKTEENRKTLAYLLGGDYTEFCTLLKAEDPKVRKNAALILGKMESEDLLPVLFDAYKQEKTLFVRADYLRAISELDYRPLAAKLEEQLSELRGEESWGAEDWKHVSEEIRILQAMVLRCRGVRRHRFSGGKEKADLILMTNRCQREATAAQIQRGKITMLAGGIRVEGAYLKEILPIRTYTELLFPLETEALPARDPARCGQMLARPVLGLIKRLCSGSGSYLFRVELRGMPEEEKKGAYIRKITDGIERESKAELINSVSDYEVEIRLIRRREGSFAAMLKLGVLPDDRFSYRKETVAASISPMNAALAVRLALPYLKEGAQVLDPFCGVGTMLIERDRALKAGTMYGIDLFGEAIEKARRNTERAGCRVNYIHRDFFTFEHGYLFDEVISDLPQVSRAEGRQEIEILYQNFLNRVQSLLKKGAVLVLYTSEPECLERAVRENGGYRIKKRFLINEKNGTAVFLLFWE